MMEDLTNIYYLRDSDRYYIQKQVHGKRYYYGSYDSLEEAIRRRDELRESEWGEPVKADYTPVKERIAKMYKCKVEDIP